MKKWTKEMIENCLEKENGDSVELQYVDYDDSFNESPEIIKNIIDGDYSHVYEIIEDWYDSYWSISYIVDETFTGEELDEIQSSWLERVAIDWCYDHNVSTPIKQLIKNTSPIHGRLEWHSNYESWVRDDEDSLYLDQLLWQLEGKIDMDMLQDDWNNLWSDYAQFAFFGDINLMSFYNRDNRKSKIIVKAGTPYWLINTRVGSCGLIEWRLEEDIVIDIDMHGDSIYDTWNLFLDNSDNWYGLNEIAWMSEDFWSEWEFTTE